MNGLGAKPVYTNMAAATRESTIFNVNYTMLFVYDSTRVEDGCWICYRGYDSNTNTIGYQLRTDKTVMTVTDTARYYKLYFTSADGCHWVPSSVNSANNNNTARPVNQRPINPFGRIVINSSDVSYPAGSELSATVIYDQYTTALGYSFNVNGGNLSLTAKTPVYLKCAPQADGSAIMDATTPIVQELPNSADGKIYILLGIAYEPTRLELVINHPVYYNDGNCVRLWTGAAIPSKTSDLINDAGFITSYTETDPTVPSWAKQTNKPSYTLDEVSDGSTRKLSNYVPTTRTVNSKTLSSDITLNLDDVSDGTTRKLSNYVPTTRTINSKVLSSNVTLTLDDIADGTSRSIPTVNNATLTIQKNGTTVNTFTANASSNATANITVPTTVAELSDASNYAQASSLTSLVATAQYNSTDKTIEFYNAAGTKLNTDIDATAFIKDGMVDDVEITNDKLVISFNTDSGKEDIEIPISDIFDASNYYTKSQVDSLIPTVNNSTITIKKSSSDTGDSFTTNASSGKTINLGLSTVATSGSYNDLSNKPTIPTDTSDLTNSAGYITGYTETDPTVPSWAKAETKPTYTASEVGALPDSTVIPTPTTARSDNNYLYNGQSVDIVVDNVGISKSNNLLNTSGVTSYIAIRANSSNPLLGLKEGSNLWYAQAASNYFYFGPTSTKALRLDQNGNGVFQTGSCTATGFVYKNGSTSGTSSQVLTADGSINTLKTVNNESLLGTGNISIAGDTNIIESISVNGTAQTITNKNVDITVPTKVSDLTNDSGFITTETDPTVPSWAKQSSKPSYTLDEVIDGSTRKLSNYVPTTRKINNQALSSDVTLTLDNVSNGSTRKLPTKVSDLTNDSGFITNSDLPSNHVTTDTNQTITGEKTIDYTKLKIGSDTIKDYTFKHGQEFIVGTQVESTNAWLGDSDQDALYDGMCINYYLPFEGTSTAATLELTFGDGITTSGAIPIYHRGNIAVTTTFPAGSIIQMTYCVNKVIGDTTITGWLANSNSVTPATSVYYERMYTLGGITAGPSGIYGSQLCLRVADNKWESICKSRSNGTSKQRNTNGFYLDSIFYYSSSNTLAEDAVSATKNAYSAISMDCRYSFNCGDSTLIANKALYLVVTYNTTDGKFYLDTTWWTQTLPSTEDNKYYVYLGITSSSTVLSLEINHPIWCYKSGKLEELNYPALLNSLKIAAVEAEIPTVPTNVSAFTNDAGYLVPSDISGKQDVLTAGEGIAITNDTVKTTGIPFGIVDSTSTSTAFTVTVPGIYKLEDGVCCLVKNGVITSASGFTLNVNNLGAKPCYSNMAAATRETTIFNANYTMLFVYDSTRIEDGAWICYRGYYSDANSVAYQMRGNVHTLPTTGKFVRYRLLFTSADGTKFVPANISTSTNATAKRDVIQTPIDPFGEIVYYSTTTAVDVGASPGASYLWTQYAVTLGYSFNRTGAALVLTYQAPVYLKCAPQSNGSAIIDADNPYVQSLPNTADNKIYIFLGIATSATAIELLNNHPVYYHDGTGIRIWTGSAAADLSGYVPTSRTINSKALSSDITLTLDDVADGTNRSIPSLANTVASAQYNSTTGNIEFYNSSGTKLNTDISATPFTKDGMIDSISVISQQESIGTPAIILVSWVDKMPTIAMVRAISGLGLAEAKAIVEGTLPATIYTGSDAATVYDTNVTNNQSYDPTKYTFTYDSGLVNINKLKFQYNQDANKQDVIISTTDLCSDYVTLNTSQTITGTKSFSTNILPETTLVTNLGSLQKKWNYIYTNNLYASGHITASSFVKTNGTSSQFLKADGSVDSNTYLTSASLSDYVTTNTAQTITANKTFTGTTYFDSNSSCSITTSTTDNIISLNVQSTGDIELHATNQITLYSDDYFTIKLHDTANNIDYDSNVSLSSYNKVTYIDMDYNPCFSWGAAITGEYSYIIANNHSISFVVYDEISEEQMFAYMHNFLPDTQENWLNSQGDLVLNSYTGNVKSDKHFIPYSDDTYTLGSTTATWSDVYAGEFHGDLDGKLSTSKKINNVSFDGSTDISSFGTCATVAAAQVKVATLDNYSLVDGTIVVIRFTYTNTATNPYLNINNTGAKRIYFGGYAAGTDTATSWMASEYVVFIYNGNYDRYYIVGKMLGGLSAGLDTLGRVIATSYTRSITATDCRGTTGSAAPTTVPAWNTTPNTLAVRASASEDLLSATGLGSVIAGTLRGFGVSGYYSSASAIMDDSVRNAESNPIGTVRLLAWERSPGTSAVAWGDPINDGVLHSVDLVLGSSGVQYDYYSSGTAVSGTWVTLSVVAGVQSNESNKVFVIIATRVM